MTKTLDKLEEFRRERLLELKNQHGSIAKLAENVGVTAGYISQLLNKHRPITEKTARKIESALGLKENWMDPRHEVRIAASLPGLKSYLYASTDPQAHDTQQPDRATNVSSPGATNTNVEETPGEYIDKLLSMATPKARKRLGQMAEDNANGLLTDDDIEELYRIAEYLKMKRIKR